MTVQFQILIRSFDDHCFIQNPSAAEEIEKEFINGGRMRYDILTDNELYRIKSRS